MVGSSLQDLLKGQVCKSKETSAWQAAKAYQVHESKETSAELVALKWWRSEVRALNCWRKATGSQQPCSVPQSAWSTAEGHCEATGHSVRRSPLVSCRVCAHCSLCLVAGNGSFFQANGF